MIEAKVSTKSSPGLRAENIAMFHFGRSGSTVLGDMLDQHPQIFWDSEIYEPFTQVWEKQKSLSGAIDTTVAPTNILCKRMTQAGKNFYGFEVKFFHLKLANVELSDYVEDIQKLGVKSFVVLERKNHLRKIVSSLVASQVSQYHQSSNKKAQLNQVKINVDNVEVDRDSKPLIDYLQDYQNSFSLLEKLLENQKVLRLIYEEDISIDPTQGYRRVCNFLGIVPRPVLIHYSKTNPFKLSEVISNFEEVKRTLSETSFEWMLHE